MTDDPDTPDYMTCAARNILKELHQLSEGCASGDPWNEMHGVFETVWSVMDTEDVFTTQLFANTSSARSHGSDLWRIKP
jgi:hypothetical protein